MPMTMFWQAARGALFTLDPELAHEAALLGLEFGFFLRQPQLRDPRLAQTVFGLNFPNPVGMAAGFDKDCRVYNALFAMGFGFAEAGTVTPLPQAGNPEPRLFRLKEDFAMINRLGFNNKGHEAAAARLKDLPPRGVLGLNIGANKESADPIADYAAGVRLFAPLASYLTINVSSPNTPGLRDLQSPDRLGELLGAVKAARDEVGASTPILVKLAPDFGDEDIGPTVDCLLAFGVDGAILTNTTLARPKLTSPHRHQAGGLSGKPLFAPATRLLAKVFRHTEGKLPLIGVGGIDSAERAVQKVRAGASLLQLYTGLVYEGPSLLDKILYGLGQELDRVGAANLAEIRGVDAESLAQ